MELLSVNLARSMWLCHINDFDPKGRDLHRLVFPLLKKLYKFRSMPSVEDIGDITAGIAFKGGEFVNSEGDPLTINLTIYNYGLVADSMSSTDNSDAFLSDMLQRFVETFNVVPYERLIRKRNYFSQLSIATDKSIELLNPKLKEISQYLMDNVLGYGKVAYQAGGISFWPDQVQSVNPPPFTIERVVTVPFSENRYLSGSALQTNKHLELLNKLEDILGS